MLKIAIIEDDKEYRESFKEFFTQESDTIECVFAVDGIETFLKYYHEELELDIILIDIQLQGINGIKGVNYIRKLDEEMELIMLTSFDDSKLIFQALTSGATGYLLKNLTFKEIESELLNTIKNGAAMSPQIARRIIKHFQPSKTILPIRSEGKLSNKENQIVQLVIDGKTYEEIAPIIGLTINGLKYHVKNIYKKLQVKSKGGLIKKFLGPKK